LKTPADGRALGISFVHQELALVPQLSVGENVFLGRHPRNRMGVAWDEIHRRTRELLAAMGHTIDPTRPVGELGVAEQQLVEIARALAIDARLIIMDEPTASLSGAETTRLFGAISELRARGVASSILPTGCRRFSARGPGHGAPRWPSCVDLCHARNYVGAVSPKDGRRRSGRFERRPARGQSPGTASRRGLHKQG
jgi:predicted ABC-type transport system involved in lysophospholipase L1 biosynthesis ATPase subunit